jgi:replicative DNA helicase
MIAQEILNELRKLSNNERLAIIEAVLEMIRKDLQQTGQVQEMSEKRRKLKQAARELLVDYMSDDELTAFKVLDGEDFYA